MAANDVNICFNKDTSVFGHPFHHIGQCSQFGTILTGAFKTNDLIVYTSPTIVGTPWLIHLMIIEQRHEISNNVVCATTKGSDQPAHTRSLIKAFFSRLNILWPLSYWLGII